MFLFLLVLSLFPGCASAQTTAPTSQPAPFEIVGRIELPQISESSGIVESRRYPGVYWTHNDSGNSADIFAITREGNSIRSFHVGGQNVDWEDIAIDDSGHLYLADIGNNNHNRREVWIYRIAEPDPAIPLQTPDTRIAADTIRLTFPATPFDAEGLFVMGDHGYIMSKNLDASGSAIYQFSLTSKDPQQLKKVADLPILAPVTGADVSRDRRYLAVITVTGPIVYRIDNEPAKAPGGWAWSAMFIDVHVEAVCFTKGGLLATTEGRRMVFFPLPESISPATQPAE